MQVQAVLLDYADSGTHSASGREDSPCQPNPRLPPSTTDTQRLNDRSLAARPYNHLATLRCPFPLAPSASRPSTAVGSAPCCLHTPTRPHLPQQTQQLPLLIVVGLSDLNFAKEQSCLVLADAQATAQGKGAVVALHGGLIFKLHIGHDSNRGTVSHSASGQCTTSDCFLQQSPTCCSCKKHCLQPAAGARMHVSDHCIQHRIPFTTHSTCSTVFKTRQLLTSQKYPKPRPNDEGWYCKLLKMSDMLI